MMTQKSVRIGKMIENYTSTNAKIISLFFMYQYQYNMINILLIYKKKEWKFHLYLSSHQSISQKKREQPQAQIVCKNVKNMLLNKYAP